MVKTDKLVFLQALSTQKRMKRKRKAKEGKRNEEGKSEGTEEKGACKAVEQKAGIRKELDKAEGAKRRLEMYKRNVIKEKLKQYQR